MNNEVLVTCECSNCRNVSICKHTESYVKGIDQIKKMALLPEIMKIKISCDYHQSPQSSKF